MTGEKPNCSGVKHMGLRRLRPQMESPGKETGTVEGRGEKWGGLREGLFDLIWLPWGGLGSTEKL